MDLFEGRDSEDPESCYSGKNVIKTYEPSSDLMLLKESGKIVGMCCMDDMKDYKHNFGLSDANHQFLHMVFIKQSYRHKGLCLFMLREVMKQYNKSNIILETCN